MSNPAGVEEHRLPRHVRRERRLLRPCRPAGPRARHGRGVRPGAARSDSATGCRCGSSRRGRAAVTSTPRSSTTPRCCGSWNVVTGVQEPNISAWRRSVCGDLTQLLRLRPPRLLHTGAAGHRRADGQGRRRQVAARGRNCPPPGRRACRRRRPGRRPHRPLPYGPWADVTVDRATGKVVCTLTNAGTAGFHYTVYPNIELAFAGTPFTVAPGATATYIWDASHTDGRYDFTVHGADGFVRRFAGTVVPAGQDDVAVPVVRAALRGTSVALTLSNDGKEPVLFTVAPNDFGGAARTAWADPGATRRSSGPPSTAATTSPPQRAPARASPSATRGRCTPCEPPPAGPGAADGGPSGPTRAFRRAHRGAGGPLRRCLHWIAQRRPQGSVAFTSVPRSPPPTRTAPGNRQSAPGPAAQAPGRVPLHQMRRSPPRVDGRDQNGRHPRCRRAAPVCRRPYPRRAFAALGHALAVRRESATWSAWGPAVAAASA